MKASNAVSTGLGLGMGLALVSHVLMATKPPRKTTRQLIVCLECQGRNAPENEFCWHCGSALYPQSRVRCSRCKALVPSMKYCGNCGSKIKK